MKCTASMEIYSYWNRLRGSRAAPLRNEIDPAMLRHLLPDLFILTGNPGSSPVFRLTGTRLYNLFGKELRDAPFSNLWTPDKAAYPTSIANGVMQHELPVLLNLEGFSALGRSANHYEMLLLPLRSNEASEGRVLGALIPEKATDIYSEPLGWLSLQRSRLLSLEQNRYEAPKTQVAAIRTAF